MNQKLEFLVATEPTTEMELSIDEFLVAKRQMGRTPATISKYRETLATFAAWLAGREIHGPSDLDNEAGRRLLRRWGAGLYDTGNAIATIRQRTATVRSLLGWLFEERIIETDLRLVLKLPNTRAEPQRTLNVEEILTLLDACDDSLIGIRNRALINFLIDTGLRAGELCRTQVADLENVTFFAPSGEKLTTNLVHVFGKGQKRDVAWFADETAAAIDAWLPIRETLTAGPELFVSIKGHTPGNPFTVSGLRHALAKFAAAAGVENVTTHSFRRSMACLAEEAGASSREVMEYGRWNTIDQVERYTQAYQAGRKFTKFSPANYARQVRNSRAGNS